MRLGYPVPLPRSRHLPAPAQRRRQRGWEGSSPQCGAEAQGADPPLRAVVGSLFSVEPASEHNDINSHLASKAPLKLVDHRSSHFTGALKAGQSWSSSSGTSLIQALSSMLFLPVSCLSPASLSSPPSTALLPSGNFSQTGAQLWLHSMGELLPACPR